MAVTCAMALSKMDLIDFGICSASLQVNWQHVSASTSDNRRELRTNDDHYP